MRLCRGCLVGLKKNEGYRFYDYKKHYHYFICESCITRLKIQKYYRWHGKDISIDTLLKYKSNKLAESSLLKFSGNLNR